MTAIAFNYTDFKDRWRQRCKHYRVDPETGANEYQVVHIRADLCGPRHLLDRRQIPSTWDDELHGPARIAGDVDETGSTWNIEAEPTIKDGDPNDWRDADFDDLITIPGLWHEVNKLIREDVSPRNWERWAPVASEVSQALDRGGYRQRARHERRHLWASLQ